MGSRRRSAGAIALPLLLAAACGDNWHRADAAPPGDVDAGDVTADAGPVPPDAAPATPDAEAELPATTETRDFFARISGNVTLSGQHNREPNASPAQWTEAVYDTTGRYPALWSGDFLFQQSNIEDRWIMVYEAAAQWKGGAIVNLMWHACPPTLGDPCAWSDVLSYLLDAEWEDLVTEGGALHAAWLARLDEIAVHLKDLEDEGVVVLFRPLHEMNQGAFWWGGRPGPDGTRRLFQITHDYLTKTKGLGNLLWVWDVQDLSLDFADYDPGPAYWDLAALDVYGGDGYTTAKYEAMLAVAGSKPIAIGECARLPTAEELAAQPRWTFFMAWAELVYSENSVDEIVELYAAPNVLTLDELDAWR